MSPKSPRYRVLDIEDITNLRQLSSDQPFWTRRLPPYAAPDSDEQSEPGTIQGHSAQ